MSTGMIDPLFMLDVVREQLQGEADDEPAREESYFAGARLHDADLAAAAVDDHQQRALARQRRAQATTSNLGLGHDLHAGLADPTAEQLDAVRAITCQLLARQFRDVIAYGAGWTDRERQQPVCDSGRSEPRQADAITATELQRALADPDPLRGVMQLVMRCAAAFVLDPDGVSKTAALGADRMARRLDDALPDGDHPLRVGADAADALSQARRPEHRGLRRRRRAETTVDLAAHRADSALDNLDLGDDAVSGVAAPSARRSSPP